jgi:hypothetical protein
MAALFQLSYSPKRVIDCEVYRRALVISCRGGPKIHDVLADDHRGRLWIAHAPDP